MNGLHAGLPSEWLAILDRRVYINIQGKSSITRVAEFVRYAPSHFANMQSDRPHENDLLSESINKKNTIFVTKVRICFDFRNNNSVLGISASNFNGFQVFGVHFL